MKIKGILEALALALALNPQVFADTTSTLNTEASRMNTLAASHGEANVTGKISGTFNSFLGSDSPAVVTGLRNGTPITLTTTTPAATPGASPTVTTTVITPPTGKMGHGNVFTSLALAKQQLGQLGISQPTPQQLQAALTGGYRYNRHRHDGDYKSAARRFDHAQPGHGLGSNRAKTRN